MHLRNLKSVASFNFQKYWRKFKILKWSHDPNHAPFRFLGWTMPYLTHVPNLKSVASSVPEILELKMLQTDRCRTAERYRADTVHRSQHQNITYHAYFVAWQVRINGDGGCRLWQPTGDLSAWGSAAAWRRWTFVKMNSCNGSAMTTYRYHKHWHGIIIIIIFFRPSVDLLLLLLLSRRSRQRERLQATGLFICSSVWLSVCRQNTKNAIFSKT